MAVRQRILSRQICGTVTGYLANLWTVTGTGAAAGMRSVLVRTGKGQRCLEDNPDLDVQVFDTLSDAVHGLIQAELTE